MSDLDLPKGMSKDEAYIAGIDTGQSMNRRDTKQLLQAMERLINTARWLHGQHLIMLHKPWVGHSAITQEGAVDLPCESCGNINQAEYELATAYRFT